MSAITIGFFSQKGGTGKTTIIASTAYVLTQAGYKVLMINNDAQMNLELVAGGLNPSTDLLGFGDLEGPSILQIMEGRMTVPDCVVKTDSGDLVRTTTAYTSWPGRPDCSEEQNWCLLKYALEPVKGDYDFILIDTAGTVDMTVNNAIVASDFAIAIGQPDNFGLQGLVGILMQISSFKESPLVDAVTLGALINMVKPRTRVASFQSDQFHAVMEQIGVEEFSTVVRHAIQASNANTSAMNPVAYNPKSQYTQDVVAFVQEMLARIQHYYMDQGLPCPVAVPMESAATGSASQ